MLRNWSSSYEKLLPKNSFKLMHLTLSSNFYFWTYIFMKAELSKFLTDISIVWLAYMHLWYPVVKLTYAMTEAWTDESYNPSQS